MQLTDLLAKPIIHLSQAAVLGHVSGFWADDRLRRVRYVAALDEETYLEQAYPLRYLRIGQDALCANREPCAPEGVAVPFKAPIYDTDGVRRGYLQDVVCLSSGLVDHIVTTEGAVYHPADVVALGKILVVKGERRIVRKRSHPQENIDIQEAFAKAPEAETAAEPKQSPQEPPAPGSEEIAYLPRAPLPQEVNALPQGVNVRLMGDYSFLLGRTLSADLVHKGCVILSKGTIIDDRAVTLARQGGLLVNLTALSV